MSYAGRVRHLVRARCRKFVSRGRRIVSYRNPDRLHPDGSITDGDEFVVYEAITCRRVRWHRGECSS